MTVLDTTRRGAISASNFSDEVSAADAKKILSIKALGIDLQMSMEQIRRILEEQGYTVSCGVSYCLVGGGRMTLAASYFQDRMDMTPLDESRTPTSIAYRRIVVDIKDCGDMLAAIELFCENGKDKFPCVQSNGSIRAHVQSRGVSDDGAMYSMDINVAPPTQCSMTVNRKMPL